MIVRAGDEVGNFTIGTPLANLEVAGMGGVDLSFYAERADNQVALRESVSAPALLR